MAIRNREALYPEIPRRSRVEKRGRPRRIDARPVSFRLPVPVIEMLNAMCVNEYRTQGGMLTYLILTHPLSLAYAAAGGIKGKRLPCRRCGIVAAVDVMENEECPACAAAQRMDKETVERLVPQPKGRV